MTVVMCHRAKQTRNMFSLSYNRATGPFKVIYCDLWGRYHTPSISGCHYFFAIVDDFSRAIWVFLLKHKEETLKCLEDFWSMVETQFSVPIQQVRSDNETEFTNGTLQ